MVKQIILALSILVVLILSQLIWVDQLWQKNRQQLEQAISTKILDSFSFESLNVYSPNKNRSKIQMYEAGDSTATPKGDIPVYTIGKKDYGTNKTLGHIIENAFLNMALAQNQIKLSFIDSLFQHTLPQIDEISAYSFSLKKNNVTVDSVAYGTTRGFSHINIDLPLGNENVYRFYGNLTLKPSVEIKNMLFSIGITSVTIILVAIFMIYQLFQLRKKTLQLEMREKSIHGIIHDLKSPLSYVYTILDYFEKSEKDSAKRQNLLTAKNRVKFLSEKIGRLLAAFKVSNSHVKMNFAPYHFNERCTEILDELKMIYKDKNIGYQISTPAELTLNVDNTYFEGCIRNLLDNAVKYSDQQVEIGITSEINNKHLLLRFKDNGPGIPENRRKKIFKEFYRVSETGEMKGHGIGLSFTKQIVEAHKGKIYIEKPDKGQKGATFVIVLPSTRIWIG